MFPLRQLPVLQNWDCHVSGNCCKEYVVTITNEEHERIANQGWEKDPVYEGVPLFRKVGPFWARRWQLRWRDDHSCIFLSDEGRCRIHERFGAEAKPLPCRLFPFILVPTGDHWRVGVRFACPSAAANLGRPFAEHEADLRIFAGQLAEREGLASDRRTLGLPPPKLQGRQSVEWSDLFRFAKAIVDLLQANEPMELRWRKVLAFAGLCRQARYEKVTGGKLTEFLNLVKSSVQAEVPVDPARLPPPGWIGRLLFRLSIALLARKDHGPNRGIAHQGRLTLLNAGWKFATGRGAVPRVNGFLGETTFDDVEARTGAITPEMDEILQRYYTIKVDSLQFCGSTNFGIPFWEGLEMLALTYPVIAWLTRALDRPGTEGLRIATGLVDDHFGYNRILGSTRQRLAFRILARTGELQRLIAWYGR